jgi:hypothetical protein
LHRKSSPPALGGLAFSGNTPRVFPVPKTGKLKKARRYVLIRASAMRTLGEGSQFLGKELASAEMASDQILSVFCRLTLSRDFIADPNKKNPRKENNESGENEPWKRN